MGRGDRGTDRGTAEAGGTVAKTRLRARATALRRFSKGAFQESLANGINNDITIVKGA
jgi:hypothetical protein